MLKSILYRHKTNTYKIRKTLQMRRTQILQGLKDLVGIKT